MAFIEDELCSLLQDLQVTRRHDDVLSDSVSKFAAFLTGSGILLRIPSGPLQRSRQPAEMYLRQHEPLLEQKDATNAPEAAALADRSDACARLITRIVVHA